MMATDFISPKKVLVEFLRHRLTDPRGRAESLTSESFTAVSSQTEFSLTPPSGKVSCITLVTVDAVTKKKWQDFWIDYQNRKVIFFTALSGGEDVDITYKYGSTNWVYHDKVRSDLSETSFPRISVMIIPSPGLRQGNYEAPVQSVNIFQIDIWTKETGRNDDQIFTIDGVKYEGDDLAEYLGYKILKAFSEYENDLHPFLYNYSPLTSAPRDLPWDETKQVFHKTVEVELNCIDIGEVS